MRPIPATVIILTKSEERNVAKAIQSAQQFDDVLVVDSNSEDSTRTIAKSLGARVLDFHWDGQYPKKKEWALGHSFHDWVIYLDADEFLTDKLVGQIRNAIADTTVSAMEVPLSYFWLGKELKHGHQVVKRIGMKRTVSHWPRPDDLHVKNMWEVEGHYQPQIHSGRVVRLDGRLGHDDKNGLFDYFARHNRYSDWEAQMLQEGDSASLLGRSKRGRIAAYLPFKPLVFFVYSFVVGRGFLDGRAGFHYALALSFYYWQIGVKRIEMRWTTDSA